MKKILTLGFVALAFSAAALAQNTPAKTVDPVKWNKTSHDFGTVKMGPPAEVVFKFTNMGKTPLVVTAAQPSCGCTTPTWTKTPVMPGKTGEVKASYGTEGRPGYFQKTINVTFDNGTSQTLTITGTVNTDAGGAGGNELK
ncbi:MAG: DUF1573 domain-containing protein [Bacteroidetes bacterium]|nr:DUF1573 domain-containing protein [Bacteroidota bacterium]